VIRLDEGVGRQITAGHGSSKVDVGSQRPIRLPRQRFRKTQRWARPSWYTRQLAPWSSRVSKMVGAS
jgi:hypothetical protein